MAKEELYEVMVACALPDSEDTSDSPVESLQELPQWILDHLPRNASLADREEISEGLASIKCLWPYKG